MKKIIFIAAMVVCFFAAVSVYAAGWEVIKCGYVNGSGVQLILTNDGGSTSITAWAKVDDSFEKEALAVALTAKTAGFNVEIGGWSGGRFGSIKLVDP